MGTISKSESEQMNSKLKAKVKISNCEILSNLMIALNTWEMKVVCDTSVFTAPGQFVNVLVEGCYLRRPLSVCHAEDGVLTLVYKVVGKGTEIMAGMTPGEELNLLYPLGNGFDTACCDSSAKRIVLVGGGVGLPPLYGLAKKLIAEGKRPELLMGFGTEDEIFYEKEFKNLGLPVGVATMDGSRGVKGTVLAAAEGRTWDWIFACGPEAMLHGVRDLAPEGQFSFESRMGCGFGVCMGCSCRTKYGDKRICVDGPVLSKEAIIW
jgi:dihydroorotate dehydrogenase electron transfer subunit